jgi:hypothetical protein
MLHRRCLYLWGMEATLKRMSAVSAVLITTALAGVLALSTVAPPAVGKPSRQLKAAHYTVSSFNVLGASHTPAGGRRAPGSRRIVWANQLLNRHHVDVAGFQEMQGSQAKKFLAITRGSWALYPGLRLKRQDSENSIGWRTDTFTLVQARTVNIPYFDGHRRAMPLVLLRDKKSGMLTYFSNFHNPAEAGKYRNQGKWRIAASRVEIRLQNRLVVKGIPRIMTGDMNERAAYFCRVTARAPLKAARPTSYRKNKVCYANRPRAVDWILGSLRTTFTNYVEDRSPLVDKTTDHPVVVSDVTVDPRRLPNGWQVHPPAPIVFKGF